ncbi:unnamed protein product, partial [Ixodes hexagonus]
DYSSADAEGNLRVKVICLGDSAVGKSNIIHMVLWDTGRPVSTLVYSYAYRTRGNVFLFISDFWDTAGQERFRTLHPSYYHQANACILVFDVTRKVTYKNLGNWYKELRDYRPHIPCFCVANKIDGK